MMSTRWRGRIKTALRLRPYDWLVIGQSLAMLSWVELRLRVSAPSRLLAWALTPRGAAGVAPSEADIRRTTHLLTMAANYHPLRPKCLSRSIALSRLLGGRGVVTQLRVGVQREDRRLLAHAWVEWNGRALTHTDDGRGEFVKLDRLTGRSLA